VTSSPQNSHPDSTVDKSAKVDLPQSNEPPVRLVETAFFASTTCLLWLLNYYFPIGPIFKIFFPLPIALIYLRWGRRSGWMAAAVATLLLSVLMGPSRSILFFFPYGIIAILLGACWRRQVGWLQSITLGALVDCVGVLFRFWLTSVLLGENLWVYLMARLRDVAEWFCLQVGILAEPSLLSIQIFAICTILMSNFLYLFVVHLVATLMFEKLGNPLPKPPAWIESLLEF
jgi:uncharacterized protein YybS (DUF2232 family)